MASEARFLVLTDLHLAGILKRDEIKSPSIPKIENPSRIAATGELLSSIADYLRRRHFTLEAVIFAGDAQDKGSKGSHDAAYQSIVDAFQEFGIDAAKIVSTPGNHDVLKGSPPGSEERYADFASVWRDKGCIVPWIDGLDPQKPSDTVRHRLVADDAQWAIYPLNTSNWSQVRANVPKDLATVWDELPKKMAQGNGILEEQVKAALGRLLDYDMANISNDQLKVFRQTVDDTPQPTAGSQVRLAVMHHHLRSPSFRVEYKPFEGITNLEQLRSVLKETNVAAAIHGHKHEHNFRYEYVQSTDPDSPHRIAVVSAGTFQDGADHDAALLLTLKGLPYTPEISVERIDLPRTALDLTVSEPVSLTLVGLRNVEGAPGMAFHALPITTLYSATKSFLLTFSRGLQGELAETGVRVQAVLPAGTATEFYDHSGIPLSAFDPAAVMTTENLVDAALAGFDRGEEVTLPSVHNVELWAAYEQARSALFGATQTGKPAPRYLVSN